MRYNTVKHCWQLGDGTFFVITYTPFVKVSRSFHVLGDGIVQEVIHCGQVPAVGEVERCGYHRLPYKSRAVINEMLFDQETKAYALCQAAEYKCAGRQCE